MDKILSNISNNIPLFLLRVVLFFFLLLIVVKVIEFFIDIISTTRKYINDGVGEMTYDEFEEYLQQQNCPPNARILDGKTDKYDITIGEVNTGLFRYGDENDSVLNYLSVTYTVHNKQDHSVYFKELVYDEVVLDGIKTSHLPVIVYNDENNTVVNNDISTEIDSDETVTITKYYVRNINVKEVEITLIDQETDNIILNSVYSA